MPEPISITMSVVIAVIVAAVITVVLRFLDPPETSPITFKVILYTFVGAILAAILFAWNMLEQGLDLWVWANFVMLVTSAAGGFVAVRGLLGIPKYLNPPSAPGPPQQ